MYGDMTSLSSSRATWHTFQSELLIAVTAAYVALLPQFYLFFSASNRYELQWTRGDHLAVVTAVCILGMILFEAFSGFRVFLARVLLPRAVAGSVACVVLCAVVVRTVLSLLDRGGGLPVMLMPWIENAGVKVALYLLFPGVAAIITPDRMKRAVRAFYAMLSPVLVLGVVAPFTYTSFNSDALPPSMSTLEKKYRVSGRPNVYIFIFDEWSYDRTFRDGHVIDEMPRLKQLLQQSTVFRRAYSPGKYTWTSVPKFLLQTDADVMAMSDGEIMRFLFSGSTHHGSTIFADSASSHLSMTVGFAFDYSRLVGHQTDAAIWKRTVEKRPSFWSHVRMLLGTQLSWMRFLGVDSRRLSGPGRASDEEIYEKAMRDTHNIVLGMIKGPSVPVFLFAHYGLPKSLKAGFTIESYMGNLRRLDAVVGDITDALISSGKMRDSLLIMTSDHSWRTDPDGPFADSEEVRLARLNQWARAVRHDPDPVHPWKHVPLIVKYPGQARGCEVSEIVYTVKLYNAIRQVVNEGAASPGVWRCDDRDGGMP